MRLFGTADAFWGACVNSQLAVVKEITPFLDLLSSQSCMSSRYILCHHVISCRLSCYLCLFCLLEGCKRRLLLAKCPTTWHFLGSEAFGGWHQILGKTPLWQSVSCPISMSHSANNYFVWFPASERLVCSDMFRYLSKYSFCPLSSKENTASLTLNFAVSVVFLRQCTVNRRMTPILGVCFLRPLFFGGVDMGWFASYCPRVLDDGKTMNGFCGLFWW